jgi:hypothetical protein
MSKTPEINAVRAICSAILVFLCYSSLHAQQPEVSATVQFANASTITVTDFSNPIGVQTNEIVNITIQFGPDGTGQNATVAADGGSVSVGSNIMVVNDDGSLRFAFAAPADPGQRVVSIQTGSNTIQLLFAVNAG